MDVCILLFRPCFGSVCSLTKDNFIDAVDKVNKNVKVFIHLYEDVSFDI